MPGPQKPLGSACACYLFVGNVATTPICAFNSGCAERRRVRFGGRASSGCALRMSCRISTHCMQHVIPVRALSLSAAGTHHGQRAKQGSLRGGTWQKGPPRSHRVLPGGLLRSRIWAQFSLPLPASIVRVVRSDRPFSATQGQEGCFGTGPAIAVRRSNPLVGVDLNRGRSWFWAATKGRTFSAVP